MTSDSGWEELGERLATLERRIEEVIGRLVSGGSGGEPHREAGDALKQTSEALREKLTEAAALVEKLEAAPAKGELEKDIQALNDSLERWVAHVDKDFGHRR